MRSHTAKRSLALAIGLCGLVALAFVSVVLSRDNEAKSRESNNIRNAMAGFYHTVVSAEKAQRAYILTEDLDYRDDYFEAVKQIGEIQLALTKLVDTRSVISADIGRLFRLTDERNSQLDLVIAAYDSLGFDAAVAAIRSNETKNTSSRIFLLIRTMVDQEGRALIEYQRRSDNMTHAALALMVLSAACGLFAAYIAFKREIERRQQLIANQRNLELLITERATALNIERLRVEELLAELSGYQKHNLETISHWLRFQDTEKVSQALSASQDTNGVSETHKSKLEKQNRLQKKAA